MYLTKGSDRPHKRIEHPSASGTYDTAKHAQGAVNAFVAAFYAEEADR